ncbi:MAG: DUF2341 domain-containing protein [Spirochaetota bacterium]|nr:DUF2341 domain-containing protein [Spirochaetota bacterium]
MNKVTINQFCSISILIMILLFIVSITKCGNGLGGLLEESPMMVENTDNRQPEIESIGNRAVDENQLLEFTVKASDPEGGELIYSAHNLPSGATFDATTQVFCWFPDYGQSGNYPDVLFVVTDNGSSPAVASESITISVGDVNRPPVLEFIGDRTVDENQLLEFMINANDPDEDDLIYSASDLPSGATFNSTTRLFSWMPSFGQTGVYSNILFTVDDKGIPMISDTEFINITVIKKWFDVSWQFRKEITVTEQSGVDLSDYQVKIELTSSNFDFTKADINGDDIRFTYYNDITNTETEISYWIEEWDSVTPLATLWTKVIDIPANDSATIYMYYGNPGVSSPSSWDNTFVSDGSYAQELSSDVNTMALWHFNEGLGNETHDVAGSDDVATLKDGYSWVAGRFGSAIDFDATSNGWAQATQGGDTGDMDITGDMTVEAWVKISTKPGGEYHIILDKLHTVTNSGFQFIINSSRQLVTTIGDGSNMISQASDSSINEEIWTHIAFTHDGSSVVFYINGKIDSVKSLSAIQATNDDPVLMSTDEVFTHDNDAWMNGILDEVRVSDDDLSHEEIIKDAGARIYVNPEPIYAIGLEESI